MAEGTEKRHMPPALTEEQRAENLKKAAEARHARSELRARVARGEASVADVLADEGDTAKRMPVSQLLMSVPGMGRAKTAKAMEELDISPRRRVQGLGARQREQLLDWLAAHGPKTAQGR